MPDKQIHPIGTENAPADYSIPSAAELLLKSIHARYDGSNAAGDFVPLVRIISNGGSTTDEIPQDATIAAGASADATWFPRVGGAAAKAGGTFQTCRVAVGASVPSGSASNPQGGTQMPIISFETSDPANYQQVDGFTWTIPDKRQTICGYAQVAGGLPTTLNGDVAVETNKLGGIALPVFGQNGAKIASVYFAYTLTRQIERNGTWTAYVGGADTHSWVMVITYSSVY